jgi:hypothetical protein
MLLTPLSIPCSGQPFESSKRTGLWLPVCFCLHLTTSLLVSTTVIMCYVKVGVMLLLATNYIQVVTNHGYNVWGYF